MGDTDCGDWGGWIGHKEDFSGWVGKGRIVRKLPGWDNSTVGEALREPPIKRAGIRSISDAATARRSILPGFCW